MFHKSFRVKSNAAIKGSDRKKWKAQIEEKFSSLTTADIAELMPSKGEITVSKLFTHNGAVVNVLSVQKNPLFFETDGAIYPTVYLLWRYPDMLPSFTTWPNVIPKLCRGADLMLPGVILPDTNYNSKSFGSLQRGDSCSVNQITNKAPLAVGTAALSSEDMFMSGKRGKGVIILHIYNDLLWALGEKTSLPDLPPPFQLSADVTGADSDFEDALVGDETETVESNERIESNLQTSSCLLDCGSLPIDSMASLEVDDQNTSTNESVSAQEISKEAIGEDTTHLETPQVDATELQFESMDDVLLYSFLKALKTSGKKIELPLLTSTFYKVYMLPSVPKGHSLDVKKSSYKKLGKFLQEMQTSGLIQVQELSKGVESIVGVHFQHPELRSFVIDKDDETAGQTEVLSKESEKSYEMPQIEEVFLITAATLPLFKLYNHSKGVALTASEVKRILTNYIKENNMQNSEQKSIVNLDPVLGQILLTKNENNVVHLSWDEIHSRCLKQMTSGYRVTYAGQESQLHKGKIPLIELNVATRAANKKVTLITNLETYGIDPQDFAHTVQIGVATSTSVTPAPNKKDGCQVLVQGNQVKFVAKLLLDEYKVPRKYISGLELASKKGKK